MQDKDNIDWAPSNRLGYSSGQKENPERAIRLEQRKEKRKRSESAIALLELANASLDGSGDTDTDSEAMFKEAQCQTDLDSNALQANEEDLRKLSLENNVLKDKLKEKSLDEEGFKKDDDKVLLYWVANLDNIICCFHTCEKPPSQQHVP